MPVLRSSTDRKPAFEAPSGELGKGAIDGALSQEAEVGVKCKFQRGEPLAHLRMLMRGVVIDDGVDRLFGPAPVLRRC